MSALEGFSAAFHRHFTRDSNARLDLGVDRDLGEMPDPSLSAQRDAVAEAQELLTQLESIDPSSLSLDDSLDIDLARLALEREVHDATYSFSGATTLPQFPDAGRIIGNGLHTLFISDPRPPCDRLRDIHGRIDGIPEFVTGVLARLETPVKRWVDIDLEQVEHLPELLSVLEGWAAESAYERRSELATACRRAEAAMTRYREKLAQLETHRDFHVGAETAQRIVELRGIPYSLEELRQIAEDFLRDTNETLHQLRAVLAPKYGLPADVPLETLHQELNRRFAAEAARLEDILDHYRTERDHVVDFCLKRKLFPIPREQDFEILRTPPFMAPSIPAGAMCPPPAFRPGKKVSLVYLTLSEELRDEHTSLGIPTMIIHEGIPGHHLQLAHGAMHPSVIRRHVSANDQAEGWTTMLEDYMLDAGYKPELADEIRFIGKRDIARIGARVAIDLYFMSGDAQYLEVGVPFDHASTDPFVRAGSLLKSVTGFTDGRVQAELNWYSQERGYPLSYLAGNRMVWDLRRDMEMHTGKSGDELARDFHQTFLEAGNMPVAMLRRVFAAKGLIAQA